jgi:hypothetical protein
MLSVAEVVTPTRLVPQATTERRTLPVDARVVSQVRWNDTWDCGGEG